MKPYDDLTRLGRLRRLRQLARTALAAYGLGDAHFELVIYAGNALYRVWDPGPAPVSTAGGLFEEGRYLLRLHWPGYRSVGEIELELEWLAAMRREADLPVPEPVPTLAGRLLTLHSFPGLPGERCCSLLRWLKGRSVSRQAQLRHLEAQGRLMARMHTFAARWPAPLVPACRRYDWDGLFARDAGSGMPNAEAWALLPPRYAEPFSVVAQRVRQAMEELGEGSDAYGLIHADLGVDANLLFWRGEPRPIDFDDCGLGYWVYDLGIALEHCWGDASFARCRDALLEGYTQVRPLPEKQVAYLELFIAAAEVYWNLWAAGGTHLHPSFREALEERIERTSGLVARYVAGR